MKLNYFILLTTLIFQFFCFDTYSKSSITFQINKIEGLYKFHREKIKDYFGESTPIYGNSSSLSYYYVNIYIGEPPQKQSVIIDTGSHLTAVPCQPYILNCGRHMNPYYDVQKSNQSSIIQCEKDKCAQINYAKCEPDNTCSFTNVIFV